MALHRETPTCFFCGEVTHEAQYKDQSNLSIGMQVFGDTFIGWEDLKHTCKGLEDFREGLAEKGLNSKLK